MRSLLWLTTSIAVVLVAILAPPPNGSSPVFGGRFDAAVTVTYIVLPGTVVLTLAGSFPRA